MVDVAVERESISDVELVDVIGDRDEDQSGLDVQQLASTSSMGLARMAFSWIEGPVPQLNDVGRLRARDEDQLRSEERRVGKECRSRWSPYH